MQRGISLNSNQKKLRESNSSSKKIGCTGYKLKKDVVLCILNRTLLELGAEAYDMVNRSLYEKYRCDISECYEKPEYLVDVLRYVCDGSYHPLMESLMKNLGMFAKEDGIKEFVHVLKTSF